MHRIVLIRGKLYPLLALILAITLIGMPGCKTKASSKEYRQIVVATGSPYELGLVDELAKAFRGKTGCVVRCIKTPTGLGLDLGRTVLRTLPPTISPAPIWR
jgi:ABC-type tungstate transport system permease subunit